MYWKLTRRLILILAVAGLVLGPVATPGGVAVADTTMGTPHCVPCPLMAPGGDGPCCPVMSFLAFCMAQSAQPSSMPPAAEAALETFVLAGLVLPQNDERLPSLSPSPPIRPPRA